MNNSTVIGIPYHVRSIIEKHIIDGCIVECTYDDEIDYSKFNKIYCKKK